MKRTNHHRAGMTLLEVLIYLVVFAMVVNAAAVLFVATLRLHAHAGAAMDQRYVVDAFQRDFLETAAASMGAVPQAGEYIAPPGELLLRLPPSDESPEWPRFALWRLDALQRPTLQRFAIHQGVWHVEYFKTYSLPVAAMECAQQEGRVAVGLVLDARRHGAVTRRFDFVAAPRVGGRP